VAVIALMAWSRALMPALVVRDRGRVRVRVRVRVSVRVRV